MTCTKRRSSKILGGMLNPSALNPNALSPDTLSPRALSPCALCTYGLSESVLYTKKLSRKSGLLGTGRKKYYIGYIPKKSACNS